MHLSRAQHGIWLKDVSLERFLSVSCPDSLLLQQTVTFCWFVTSAVQPYSLAWPSHGTVSGNHFAQCRAHLCHSSSVFPVWRRKLNPILLSNFSESRACCFSSHADLDVLRGCIRENYMFVATIEQPLPVTSTCPVH